MKKINVKILSIFVMLVILVSSFVPTSVSAAETIEYSTESNSGTRDVVCNTLDGTSAASYYNNYNYDDLAKLSASALFTELQTLMRNTHTYTSSYDDCHYKANLTDCENNNTDYLSLIYTSYDATQSQWNGWNREHVWPKSLGGDSTTGGGADLHHIRPSDAGVNSSRGNKMYGESGSDATEKYGTDPAVGVLGGTYNSDYFEPLDNVKGDVARICLYVYVRWNTNWGADSITKVFESVDVLLQWCEEDPVDTWEMGRNEVVGAIQGNRNVFIDYPEYAWLLFDKEVPNDMVTPSGKAMGTESSGGSTGGGNVTGGSDGEETGTGTVGTVTLSFDSTANRTSFSTTNQVWQQNGITFTNDKNSSTNDVADYSNPVRLYGGSSVTVGYPSMTEIVFACDSSSYATSLGSSIAANSNYTVTTSGNNVTVTFDSPTDSFTISSLSAQVRLDSISVSYNNGSAGTEDPDCTHTNLDVTETEATKTEPGYRITTCLDCGEEISREQIADALGYAVSYSVPAGLVAPAGVNTLSATMPEAVEVAGYTFVGWTTSTVDEATSLPTVHTAGSVVDITADTTFYALYSFTDDSAPSTTYEKYTGAITEGYYVITYNTYAMSNAISSSRLTYATIAPSNDALENPDANIIWKIEYDGTYYTLYNEAVGKYAAGTGVKNKAQLLASVTDYAKWTVSDSDSTYEFVNLGNANAGVNKNLRNNGDYGFACYSTSTGGALTLYKQAASGGMAYTTSPTVSDCEHTNTTTETVDATCTAAGSITERCDNCGAVISTETIPATGHGTTTKTTTDATCTTAGSITETCDDCGEVVSTETIPATGHLNTTETTIDATCTEEGSITETCDDCGATVSTESIAALGHNFEGDTCSRCGLAKPSQGGTTTEEIVFEFGENGTAAHDDGTELKAVKSYEDETGSYTLTITSYSKLYIDAYDAKGNSALKFGSSSAAGNMTFTVPDEVTSIVIYAAKYKENTSKIVINGGAAQTLTNSSNDGQYDAIVVDTSTNKTVTITTASGGYRIMLDKIIYVIEGSAPACEHTNTTTETVDATCTTAGSITETCDDCGEVVSTETIPVLAHNYVDGECTVCGHIDSASYDYSGKYYIATIRTSGNYFYMSSDLGTASTQRYTAIDSGLTTLPTFISAPEAGYVFVLVKNSDGTYCVYAEGVEGDNYLGWTSGNSGTLVSEANAIRFTLDTENGIFNLHFADPDGERYLSLNNASNNNYFAFYTSVQKRDLALIPVASFTSASLNIGEDLTIRYHAILGEDAENYTVRFTMNDDVVTVLGVLEGEKYVFSFTGIAPQCMGDTIKAELLYNGTVIGIVESYSVKQYVIDALELYPDYTELRQLLSDLLYYGAAAQEYVGYKTDAPVTDDVDILSASTATPDTTTRDVTDADENAPATFKSAGVRFDYNNRVYVKFVAESIDGIAVYADGVALEITETEVEGVYVAYSGGISALEFDRVIYFTLTSGGSTIQTLTYSVNDYAYGKKDSGGTIADLALALYRYGISAKTYDSTK